MCNHTHQEKTASVFTVSFAPRNETTHGILQEDRFNLYPLICVKTKPPVPY